MARKKRLGKTLEHFFKDSTSQMEGDMDGLNPAMEDASLRRNIRRFLVVVAAACIVSGVLYLISFIKSL